MACRMVNDNQEVARVWVEELVHQELFPNMTDETFEDVLYHGVPEHLSDKDRPRYQLAIAAMDSINLGEYNPAEFGVLNQEWTCLD